MKIIDKAFYDWAYAVGCRKIQDEQNILPSKSQNNFSMLMPTQSEWYADSFCFCDNDKVFVFMEIMGRNGSKGTLGVAEFKGGGFSAVTEILREPFHLSYPNVFKFEGHYYMIPETNEACQIRLYESTEFPFKWELKKVLADNLQVVDSSFTYLDENNMLLFSQDISEEPFKIRNFKLNLKTMDFSEILRLKNSSEERPGGNTLCVNGTLYRPLQDCERVYGERLKLYQVDCLSENAEEYKEHYFGAITAAQLPTDKHAEFVRTHTISRSGEYEAVDVLYKKFYLFKGFKKIAEKLKR